MTAVNLNSYPYWDDYNPSNGFHKIAFIPGRPIQARELTQIQSILQDQVRRVGNHFFKNGTVITGGNSYYDNTILAIRLEPTNVNSVLTDSFVDTLKDVVLENESHTKAKVMYVEKSSASIDSTGVTTSTPAILYVRFIDGGDNNVIEFKNGDYLTGVDDPTIKATVTTTYTATSKAALVYLSEGIFYANGYFVQALAQTISLASTTDKPTIQVGLSVVESIVTEADDQSLYDNAIGSTNYSAPGAHRMKIALELTTREYDQNVTLANQNNDRVDFILMYSIYNGEMQYTIAKDTEYTKLEALLAKRTYEESGDYIIDDFDIDVIDYRTNSRGAWASQTAYLDGDVITNNNNNYFAVSSGVSGTGNPPIHTQGTVSDGGIDWTYIVNKTQYENTGLLSSSYGFNNSNPLKEEQAADDSFALRVKDGVAYIQGYRTEIQGTSIKIANKARTYSEIFNAQTNVPNPITVYASNWVKGNSSLTPMYSIPDIQNLDLFNIKDDIQTSGAGSTGNIIGTCRIKSVEPITGGQFGDEKWKLAIFDIKMNAGKEFMYNAVSLVGTVNSSATVINLSRRTIPIIGDHTTSRSYTSGANNYRITGISSNYDQDLRVGNFVAFNSERTGLFYPITSVVDDVECYATGIPDALVSQKIYISVVAYKPGAQSSISPLPKKNIRTMRSVDNNGNNNTIYNVIKQITKAASGTLTYVCPPGENLHSSGHLMYIENTSTPITVLDSCVSSDGKTLTVTGLSANTYRIHARISKSNVGAAERLKTFKSMTVYVFSTGAYLGDSTSSTACSYIPLNSQNSYLKTTAINIGKADVIRINSIKSMTSAATTYSSANEIDVTSDYIFDAGQRAEFYDFATITKKDKTNPAKGPLKITFDYFEHTAGDYFTVDSYVNFPYALIPTVNVNGIQYNLRDCIDFRIRVNDSGTGSNTFYSVGDTMQTNEVFGFDYSYYLGRKDLVYLTSKGEINYIYGEPAEKPTLPKTTLGTAMLIAKVNVAPYTYNAEVDVLVDKTGNRNYTMRDINKIDNRLSNVEAYVQMSLLEKKTLDYSVKDKYGMDRLKNGFFVADFVDETSISNFGASFMPDYRACVDTTNRAMIPGRFSTEYPVLVVPATASSGSTSDSVGTVADMTYYGANAKIMTLAPNSVRNFNLNGLEASGAPLFSTKLNVNPYNVFSYAGTAKASPAFDSWQTSFTSSETLFTDAGNVGVTDGGKTSTSFAEVANHFKNSWVTTSYNAWRGSWTSAKTINMSDADIIAAFQQGMSIDVLASWMQLQWLGPVPGKPGWSFVRLEGQSERTMFDASSVSGFANSLANLRNMLGRFSQANSVTLDQNSVFQENVKLIESQPLYLERTEQDRFIRPRVVAIVARGLMPNVLHNLSFDNADQSTGKFDVLPAIKVIINLGSAQGLQNAIDAKTFKFYEEHSAYQNVDSGQLSQSNVTSGLHRSFAEWSGNDYESAVNGQLLTWSYGGDAGYGLVAGWEKHSTYEIALYFFPTKNFGGAIAIPIGSNFTISMQNELNSGTSYWTNTSATYGCYRADVGWYGNTSKPRTSGVGNVFALIKIKKDNFRTGEKTIKLERDPSSSTPTTAPSGYLNYDPNAGMYPQWNVGLTNDSSASTEYTASGISSYFKQRFVYRVLGELNVVTGNPPPVLNYGDPLAQTFVIKKSTANLNSDYVMLSGVSIYMATVPNSWDTIRVEIVKCSNGFPTGELATPWASTFYYGYQLLGSVANASNYWNNAVTFRFPAPVTLKTGTEYAIRVIAPTSNGFEVWTSKMGQECVNVPGQLITAQQADGSLFLSQNASTWTPDQYSDLAAKLHILTYPTNISTATPLRTDIANGMVGYMGQTQPLAFVPTTDTGANKEFRILPLNPFGSNGTTSTKIKVYHPYHPFYATSKGSSFVKLVKYVTNDTSDSGTEALKAYIDGIYFKVEDVKPNSYTLDLGNRYSAVGTSLSMSTAMSAIIGTALQSLGKKRWGKNLWAVVGAGYYDFFKLGAEIIEFPGTTSQWTKKMVYQDLTTNKFNMESTYDVFPLNTIIQTDKQYVSFLPNELQRNISDGNTDFASIPSEESQFGVNFRMHLSTANQWITPILKLDSLHLNVGKNLQKVSAITDNVSGTTDFSDNGTMGVAFVSADNSIVLPTSSNRITEFNVGATLGVSGVVIAKTGATGSWATNVATITLAGHGFKTGDIVTISGMNVGNYNITTGAITKLTDNTFSYALTGSGIGNGTGGTATGPSLNNGSWLITNIDQSLRKIYLNADLVDQGTVDGSGIVTVEVNATLSQGMEYLAESNPTGGTSQAKYITREVQLATPSSSLHITAAMSTPSGANIELWYRTGNEELSEVNWTKYDISNFVTPNSRSFYENKLEINNLPEFIKFQLKFVFTSTSQYNPALKELRVIALL